MVYLGYPIIMAHRGAALSVEQVKEKDAFSQTVCGCVVCLGNEF